MIKPDRHTINQFIKEGKECEAAMESASIAAAEGDIDMVVMMNRRAMHCSTFAFTLSKLYTAK